MRKVIRLLQSGPANFSTLLPTLILLLTIFSFSADAGQLTFAWNPSTGTNIDGYRVFSRTANQSFDYNNPEWEGTGTTCTIVVPDDIGFYFVVRAYDTNGTQSGDSNELYNPGAINQCPIADAGPDQTVNASANVILNGANSTDPDDGVSSYNWSQISGPLVVLDNPTNEVTTFTAPDAGPAGTSMTFLLMVSDYSGLTSQDSCIVNVAAGNTPPVADAGQDQTVSEGSLVTLNGSNSNDTDGNIDSYFWTQVSGLPVVLSNPEAVTTTFTAPDVGSNGTALTFRLTVTDSMGIASQDTINVNITWNNTPPVADAGMDKDVNAGDTVTLDGSRSTDADDGIAAYQWTQTLGTPVDIIDPTGVQTSFTAPDIEGNSSSLEFQLTVTDKGGLRSDDSCKINISGVGDTFLIDALAAQNGTISPAGSTLVTSGSDQSFTIRPFDNYHIADVLVDGVSAGPVGTYTFNNVTAGHTIAAVFEENISYQPPSAQAGQDQFVKKGDTVFLDGSGSFDPDGVFLRYRWTQVDGIPVTLSNCEIVRPSFTAPTFEGKKATVTFRLTVTDSDGLKSSDDCTVEISKSSGGGPLRIIGLKYR